MTNRVVGNRTTRLDIIVQEMTENNLDRRCEFRSRFISFVTAVIDGVSRFCRHCWTSGRRLFKFQKEGHEIMITWQMFKLFIRDDRRERKAAQTLMQSTDLISPSSFSASLESLNDTNDWGCLSLACRDHDGRWKSLPGLPYPIILPCLVCSSPLVHSLHCPHSLSSMSSPPTPHFKKL